MEFSALYLPVFESNLVCYCYSSGTLNSPAPTTLEMVLNDFRSDPPYGILESIGNLTSFWKSWIIANHNSQNIVQLMDIQLSELLRTENENSESLRVRANRVLFSAALLKIGSNYSAVTDSLLQRYFSILKSFLAAAPPESLLISIILSLCQTVTAMAPENRVEIESLWAVIMDQVSNISQPSVVYSYCLTQLLACILKSDVTYTSSEKAAFVSQTVFMVKNSGSESLLGAAIGACKYLTNYPKEIINLDELVSDNMLDGAYRMGIMDDSRFGSAVWWSLFRSLQDPSAQLANQLDKFKQLEDMCISEARYACLQHVARVCSAILDGDAAKRHTDRAGDFSNPNIQFAYLEALPTMLDSISTDSTSYNLCLATFKRLAPNISSAVHDPKILRSLGKFLGLAASFYCNIRQSLSHGDSRDFSRLPSGYLKLTFQKLKSCSSHKLRSSLINVMKTVNLALPPVDWSWMHEYSRNSPSIRILCFEFAASQASITTSKSLATFFLDTFEESINQPKSPIAKSGYIVQLLDLGGFKNPKAGLIGSARVLRVIESLLKILSATTDKQLEMVYRS